jgi:hypothetical protein
VGFGSATRGREKRRKRKEIIRGTEQEEVLRLENSLPQPGPKTWI